jgi:hypothetical protein
MKNVISAVIISLGLCNSVFAENISRIPTNENFQENSNDFSGKIKNGTVRVGLLGLTCAFSGGIYTITGDNGFVSCVRDPDLFHRIGRAAKEKNIKTVEISFHSMGSEGAVEGATILSTYGVKSVVAGMDPIVCDMKDKMPQGTKFMDSILSVGWNPCNSASHLMLFTLPPHTTQTLNKTNQTKIINFFNSNRK